MKKVLFLVNHDVTIYNFRYELVETLVNKGYDVYISSPNGDRIKFLTDIGCKFIETDVSRHGTNPVTDFKLFVKYLKIMKSIKPDVVISYTIKPNIYGGMAAAMRGIPFFPNVTGLGVAVNNKGVARNIILTLYKLAFRKAACVFFQNSENRKFFEDNKLYKGVYKVIPGSGVNIEKFIPLEYPDKERVDFVYISRIMKDKGIEEYFECAEYIEAKYKNVKFHICGFCEDNYEERLKDFVRRGIVEYHGMVSDVRTILKDCSALIHPSYHEGMSNVLLEASACARPCLCSDIAGCKEIVADNETGFLFKPGDVESLINAVEKFLNLTCAQRKEMGVYARRKVEKEFDRQIVIDAYLSEINKVARKHIIKKEGVTI